MSRALRVALLAGGGGGPGAVTLAGALHRAGHAPTLMTPDALVAPAGVDVLRLRDVPDRPLRSRSIGDGLAHVPHACVALARGHFDLAHAFSPADALPAVVWARRSSRPVVLTFVEPLQRETIGNRRLRLATLEQAIERADLVLAADEGVRTSLRRLLALDAPVVSLSDADGHVALYRALGGGD